ncbi:MAG: MurR/RpiR family transcriptional regulator, partial [Pseudomonadota bacterium]
LFADMVSSTLNNIEETFSNIDEDTLQRAGEMIWNCDDVYVLGVGVNNSCINNFAYLARTCMVQFHAIPRPGSTPIDDLAWSNQDDVLIAITCRPYRSEVVQAVKVAKDQGMRIIAISDSPASPIIRMADIGFTVSVETPQFFPSSVATIALLETLLSFVIANASDRVVERAETFQKRRHELGIYEEGSDER